MDKFFLDEIEKIDVLCLSSLSKTKITASNSGHKIDVVKYSTILKQIKFESVLRDNAFFLHVANVF